MLRPPSDFYTGFRPFFNFFELAQIVPRYWLAEDALGVSSGVSKLDDMPPALLKARSYETMWRTCSRSPRRGPTRIQRRSPS